MCILADGAINLLQERRNTVLGDEPGVNGEKDYRNLERVVGIEHVA